MIRSTRFVFIALGVSFAGPGAPKEAPAPPPAEEATAPAPAAPEPAAPAPVSAVLAHATLQSTSGVGGTISFSEQGGTVTVAAHLTGVTAGDHGFHIHETGDCSS